MANKQDVEFSLSATVAGIEKIKALRDEVNALAKEGGAVGPEFQQLADELDRLGKEASGLTELGNLAQEVEQLSSAQAEAAVTAEKLGAAQKEIVAAADGARASERELVAAYNEANDRLREKRLELARYKAETQGAARETDLYRNTLKTYTDQIITARREKLEYEIALRKARETTREVAEAEKKATTEYDKSATALKKAADALQEREGAQQRTVQSLRDMGVATNNLSEAEAQLAAKFAQTRAEQQRLTQLALDQKQIASEYATWWSNALYAQESAQKRAAEAARQSAEAQAQAQRTLQESFKNVGATDVQALRTQLAQVKASLDTLKQSGNLTGSELQVAMKQAAARTKELELQIREATGQLTMLDRVNKVFSTSFGQTFAAFVASNVFMRIIDMVTGIGRAFFDSNKQLESFRLALTSVYGSTEVASRQLGFLRRAASDAGISIKDISQEFVKFSAAFANAGIPLEQTNDLFARLTKASAILGLSSEDTGRAINALGQMASKGVVSMEELRQQLGDALPGAFQIAAKGLGVTEKQLTALVESGQLASRDFIPAFSDGLKTISGDVDTMSARLNDGLNVFTVFVQRIGDTGVWLALKTSVGFVVEVFRALALTIGSLAIGFENSVGSIAVFVAALSEGKGLSGALDAVSAKSAESNAKLAEYAESLGYAGEKTKEVASSQGDLQRQLIQTQLSYAENLKIAEKASLTSRDHAKAIDAEADAMENSAKAFGSDTQQRQASVAATAMRAEALAKEAVSEQATLSLMDEMIKKRVALLETEKAQLELQNLSQAQKGTIVAEREKEIEDLRRKAAAQAEVAERSRQVAEGARIAADAARLEAEMAKDNADRVKELTAAYDAEVAKLKELKAAKENGMATDKQVAAQQEVVNKANKLRIDALDDEISRIKAVAANKKAEMDGTQALNDLRMQELKNLESLGKSIGDENLVRYANVEMLRLQIKTIQLKAEAQRVEAEAEKQIIAIERQKIESTRELTATERIEFDTRMKLADVKIKQAQATDASTKAMENEITATQNGTASLSSNTKTRQESNKVRQDELRLIKEKAKYDENGNALNTEGDRVNMGMPTWLSIFNDLKGYGVTEDRARAIARQFTDDKGNVQYFDNPGQIAYGGSTLSMAVLNAATRELINASPTSGPAASSAEPTQAAESTSNTATNDLAPAQGNTVTMNFNFNGQQTSISGLNKTQADSLKAVVEQLSNMKGTSA